MRLMLPLLALIAASPATAADLPPDVANFLARRERCDHFRGEDSDDPARIAEIRQGLAANCRGTDAELARLKRRHAGRSAIRARLDALERRIE